MDPQVIMASPATLALLAATTLVSMAAFTNAGLIDSMLFDVGRIRRDNEWHRMITSGFIHGDPGHLMMNMLSLFFIGVWLEQMVGTWTYLAFYMACLVAGSA